MSNIDIKQVQCETLEVLIELDRICKEMNIQYYITAGTLLGAVRHHGFIPWDDDADVVMFRKDYERFSREVTKNIGRDFYFQDHRNFSNYPMGFAKLRKKYSPVKEQLLEGTNLPEGAFVDIFPLDLCPNNSKIASLFFKGTNIINAALLAKSGGRPWVYGSKRITHVLYSVLLKLPFNCAIMFREIVRRFFALFSDGSILCTVSGRHGYPQESYKKEWFSNSMSLSFEEHSVQVPSCYDDILKQMYGDYMTPIKEDNHIL